MDKLIIGIKSLLDIYSIEDNLTVDDKIEFICKDLIEGQEESNQEPYKADDVEEAFKVVGFTSNNLNSIVDKYFINKENA